MGARGENPPVLVHFLRHGESASNAEPGRDLPDSSGDRLTVLGHEQAALAAEHLTGLGVTALWTSPLRRARETAAPLAARLELEPEVHDDLRELSQSDGYGELSGEEQRLRRWSNWMAEHPSSPAFAPPGGESFAAVGARVARLKRALVESGQERVLAVSHGIFLRFFFVDSLLGEEFQPAQARRLWQLRTLNCGLSVFEHSAPGDPLDPAEDEWRCLSWMGRPWDPP